ncbi:3-deoxy-D-manno-octulosonic acid transferase [Lampropedia cohaerens]|uniref:3-deoxy-D-manno-octulosonic acid transferase n=2 Tax=Lampropedia cohaerens TaxID=1610491 RepID=A0A0U1Q0T8_9BURK|nr:3-deoxy-D-manno-octulosonic acid transferase [Lampropedia cohaerens]KKW68379.1 3-deoxy-D-manno-octulosonic acid transferase [Lampropedia cohaerens]
MWLVQPLYRRKLRRRARAESGYGHALPERFARYGATATVQRGDPAHPVVWLHAVSLGETRAAGALIAALRERIPAVRFVLTSGTATGWQEATRHLRAGDAQTWLPWDTPGAVRRFLEHFQPQLGLLMETEVWPNMVEACARRGLPLWLVNARLNARSAQRIARARWLMGPAYRHLDAVLAQSEADATRLRAVGAPVRQVSGNIKFDARPDPLQVQQGRQWAGAFKGETGRAIVMLASSRDGEEAQWLAALQARTRREGIQWLVVPRHPQRFDAVAQLCVQAGFAVSRRSAWQDAPTTDGSIWLGDSMGEMALYYAMADVALLGGSFLPLGGQNLIEACACGCPVVMGPHTFNFAQAAQDAEHCGSALRVADMRQAVDTAQALVADGERLAAMRACAASFAVSHQGALGRTVDAIARALERA